MKSLLKPDKTKAKCGTTAGYIRHRKQSEPYCDSCKEANSIYMKAYREKRGDELKAKKRAYQQANKIQENGRAKEWRKANPERARRAVREWVQKFPERKKESDKNWAKANIETVRSNSRRSHHRRRARKIKNGFQIYTERQVLDLYGTCCHICNQAIDLSAPRSCKQIGWENGLQLDHVIPIARGGSDSLDNVRPSQGLCNIKKGAK